MVIDTNVVSELAVPAPNPNVLAWMAGQPRSTLWLTAIPEAELLFGIELMPHGRRRDQVAGAVRQIIAGFGARIAPFDSRAAAAFASIAATRQHQGRPVSVTDAQIAATALSRGASLIATRDTGGFEGCGVPLLNPWNP